MNVALSLLLAGQKVGRRSRASLLLRRSLIALAVCLATPWLHAEETPAPVGIDAEAITRAARPSIAALTVEGRDGKQQGMGTGFVVSADGLIATNLHVIGEARPIRVTFPSGKSYDVTGVHASDRSLDLAVVKIDAEGLPPLALGLGAALAQGEPIVVMGNPQGLRYSVVSGVVSGLREVEGREMLQVAIPVEPGNSGGPVFDRQGRVVGIVTMKSLITDNLGFAALSEELRSLLDKPNPVPMSRWLTIGALDRKRWTPLFGAQWRQRAGKIVVSGTGEGFGGRSLCLCSDAPPRGAFEAGVWVRLDDEAGAAGLVFHSDGGDRHYGFYPSNGRLRLSRFDGPTVFTWHVLSEVDSPHYRPGQWNYLKVRVEKEKLLCYVNDALVIESADRALAGGKIGLAKFRQTSAEFNRFEIGERLPSSGLDAAVEQRVRR
ncbi:MAG: trypsin-like peptidase domain-containing protein, partial [Planctomycetales bacterium]|nr:trypsin-like peptidase domain-containing protein [Planctomycetales bacterium]